MSKDDVQVAINSEFKRQFKTLKYSGDYKFIEIDNSTVCFTIQGKYIGTGDYSVEGVASLMKDKTAMLHYKLSCSVKVECEDNSPKITFTDTISVSVR